MAPRIPQGFRSWYLEYQARDGGASLGHAGSLDTFAFQQLVPFAQIKLEACGHLDPSSASYAAKGRVSSCGVLKTVMSRVPEDER